MKFNRFIARYQWKKIRRRVITTDNKGQKIVDYEPSWPLFKEKYLTENKQANKKKGE